MEVTADNEENHDTQDIDKMSDSELEKSDADTDDDARSNNGEVRDNLKNDKDDDEEGNDNNNVLRSDRDGLKAAMSAAILEHSAETFDAK